MPSNSVQLPVSSSPRRVDVASKVTGQANFLSDSLPANCLHMGVLHPPIARGRVRRLDVSRASSAEGVHAVLVHSDLPAAKRIGMIVNDQNVIADAEFFCASDVLAILAAETPEQVRRALPLIELEVEPLPGVYSVEEALVEGAPGATDSNNCAGNVQAHFKVRVGDAVSAFDSATVIVESEVQTHHVDHGFLEPEASLAWFESDGTLVVRGCMQGPFITRNKVAQVMGMPVNKVRVQVPFVGGGFGGKEDSGIMLGAWTALLARVCNRPVCYQRNRAESMWGNGKREPMKVRHRLAANETGDIVAMEAEILLDKGAYTSVGASTEFVSGTLKKAMMHSPGPYRTQNVNVDAKSVFTNNVPTCAMRGLGVPQVHFALETQIDDLACKLGVDPIEMRLRNCLRIGDTTFAGQHLTNSVGIAECLEKVAEISGWHTSSRSSGSGRFRRGRGVAAAWYSTGNAFQRDAAGAALTFTEDGSVSASVNIVEMGQGSVTVFTQVVAKTLGVNSDDVRMMPVDTAFGPNAGITAGSRSTTTPGRALFNAASELRGRFETLAAELLEVDQSDLEVAEGCFGAPSRTNKSVRYSELVPVAIARGIPLFAQGWQAAPPVHVDMETGKGIPFPVFAYGAHVVEVEVDTATGRTRVLETYAAHDVGYAINKSAIVGQVEGGMVQAIGQALYEELSFDEGVPINPNFTDYLLPTSLEAPRHMEVAIIESPYENGPYGAKGVGEISLIPTMAAIANAIFAATDIRVREMPATAPRLLNALRGAQN